MLDWILLMIQIFNKILRNTYQRSHSHKVHDKVMKWFWVYLKMSLSCSIINKATFTLIFPTLYLIHIHLKIPCTVKRCRRLKMKSCIFLYRISTRHKAFLWFRVSRCGPSLISCFTKASWESGMASNARSHAQSAATSRQPVMLSVNCDNYWLLTQ